MLKKIGVVLLTIAFLQGCSNINASGVADSATTYVGLGMKGVVEANPMFSSFDKAPIAIGGFVLTKGIEYSYKTFLPKESCISNMHRFSSLKWGAAGNNLAIILGADGKLPLAIGVMSGLIAYNQPVNQLACDDKRFFNLF